MNWIPLTTKEQLEIIKGKSHQTPQVIFKHSTRCSISSMVLSRLERSDSPEGSDFYLLDLIQYRSVSNQIAEDFRVEHESPQVLLIKNGSCLYSESHMAIDMADLISEI